MDPGSRRLRRLGRDDGGILQKFSSVIPGERAARDPESMNTERGS
jgi:hypothetical protein